MRNLRSSLSNRVLPKQRVHKRAVKHSRMPSLLKLTAYAGFGLGAILLVLLLFILAFGGAILNGYGKEKVVRALAKAHPESVLRIGELAYSVGANRLVADSVTLSSTNTTLKAVRVSLTGVRWAQLLWGRATLADALAKASVEAANIDVEFHQSHYGLRCARVRASVPDSELIAEGTELRSLVDDEAFFAAHDFRTTRFHVVVPECKVLDLAYDELLQGKSYRARSVYFSRPSFDAFVNRDKPSEPFVESPLMVHEALAAIRQPLQVDSLSITNGTLTYRERVIAGAEPGVLTVGSVSMSVAGIANRGNPSAALLLQAQGDLMNAGTLRVLMSVPIAPTSFSLHYSGSLGAMDLTRLDAFLDIAERTRVKSGSAQEVAFDIDVTAGQARGWVRAIYKDLKIAVLDKQTDTEKGLGNRVASFLSNALKIRNANAPDASGSIKDGKVNYARRPEDEFTQFVWFALRGGVLDVISH